jgi:hypothetical protein
VVLWPNIGGGSASQSSRIVQAVFGRGSILNVDLLVHGDMSVMNVAINPTIIPAATAFALRACAADGNWYPIERCKALAYASAESSDYTRSLPTVDLTQLPVTTLHSAVMVPANFTTRNRETVRRRPTSVPTKAVCDG